MKKQGIRLMRNQQIQNVRILAVLALLSGCASHMNEEFDCPAGKGMGCQSVTEVKKKLNQGQISVPETTTEAYQRGGSGSLAAPLVMNATRLSTGEALEPVSFIDSNGMMIQRTPEKPLRVWIAPYQDQEGNLREASVVHTVVRPGYWQMNPISDFSNAE